MKSCGMTIQMKATEQYFPVALFILLYKMVLTFDSVDEMVWCRHASEPIEQYFPVVLSIMLHKMVFTFESVDEFQKCDHSNESYLTLLSCGTMLAVKEVLHYSDRDLA